MSTHEARERLNELIEQRANPTGYNQYKHMSGSTSPSAQKALKDGPRALADDGGDGSLMNPGPLPPGVKPSAASIRNHVKKTLETGGVDLTKKDVYDPVFAPGQKYTVGSTKRVVGTKVNVYPMKFGSDVSISYKTHSDLLAGREALKAAGYRVGPDPRPGVLGDSFSIKHPV